MLIDFIRHGEVDGPNCFRGRTDTPLSDNGWQQLRQATGRLKPDLIISSPLQRCKAFSQQWAQQLAVPLSIEPAFTEMDFGEWDGKTAEEIERLDSDMLYSFWNDPSTVTPPGAESYEQFQQRLTEGLRTISLHDASHIAVLTHGGVIKTLVSLVLEIPAQNLLSIETPLASRTRIRVSNHDEQFYFSLLQHGIGL